MARATIELREPREEFPEGWEDYNLLILHDEVVPD